MLYNILRNIVESYWTKQQNITKQSIGGISVQAYNPEEIDKKYSCQANLGVTLEKNHTIFRIWSPLAKAVILNLYMHGTEGVPFAAIEMERSEKGVWEADYNKNAAGLYYTYEYRYGDDGCEEIAVEGVDPYAKAVSVNGFRGYICNLSGLNPAGWDKSEYVPLKNYTDAILYELHVRDFSQDPSGGIYPGYRGLFRAFTQDGTATVNGSPTGLAHLKSMGITHVHLLPVFDYGRLDESHPKDTYNWGYDPTNYNVPEGSYSTDPFNPEARIRELKELVLSLHNQGIGVVMDVVYNHTYYLEESNLNKSFPGYYYRYIHGTPSNGSGCGNEIASDHAMARKYILDSLKFWAQEYKIDGFRFDLMACLDTTTLNLIADELKAINPNVILYGEGWSGGGVAISHEIAASKYNAHKTPSFAYFNDGFRDAIKGETFLDTALGYISGNFHLRPAIINGLLARERWCPSPNQVINYCEAHDNLTLWDKLMVSAGGYHNHDRKKMARLAMALVLLAQGVPFLQAGQEFLRSKPLGDGKFDHNSYSSPDSVNSIKWDMLDKNRAEVDYIRGIIAYRKAHRLFRMTSNDEIAAHAQVLDPFVEGTITIKLFSDEEELLLLVNPIPRARAFMLPEGEWELNISDCEVSSKPLAILCEGVFVPPISVMVLKKHK